jgi:hypothetical protein
LQLGRRVDRSQVRVELGRCERRGQWTRERGQLIAQDHAMRGERAHQRIDFVIIHAPWSF